MYFVYSLRSRHNWGVGGGWDANEKKGDSPQSPFSSPFFLCPPPPPPPTHTHTHSDKLSVYILVTHALPVAKWRPPCWNQILHQNLKGSPAVQLCQFFCFCACVRHLMLMLIGHINILVLMLVGTNLCMYLIILQNEHQYYIVYVLFCDQ